MKFLQQLAFIVLISNVLIQIPVAKAEENGNVLSSVIPFDMAYSYKNDPLLIDWTLHQEKPVESDAIELSTEYTEKEEAILAKRWYGKQGDKWKNLPKGKFTINASAYTAAADECGKNDGKIPGCKLISRS
jgi:hypothetical protein